VDSKSERHQAWCLMPAMQLSDQELDALTAYLETLR
jgi:hypothetical protein